MHCTDTLFVSVAAVDDTTGTATKTIQRKKEKNLFMTEYLLMNFEVIIAL